MHIVRGFPESYVPTYRLDQCVSSHFNLSRSPLTPVSVVNFVLYKSVDEYRWSRLQFTVRRITHSLTAALDQLRVVASSTSNDPGPRSRQHQQIGQCLLPLVAANFFVDDPAGASSQRWEQWHVTHWVGGVPVWASIDSCSVCEAGVFSGRRQM